MTKAPPPRLGITSGVRVLCGSPGRIVGPRCSLRPSLNAFSICYFTTFQVPSATHRDRNLQLFVFFCGFLREENTELSADARRRTWNMRAMCERVRVRAPRQSQLMIEIREKEPAAASCLSWHHHQPPPRSDYCNTMYYSLHLTLLWNETEPEHPEKRFCRAFGEQRVPPRQSRKCHSSVPYAPLRGVVATTGGSHHTHLSPHPPFLIHQFGSDRPSLTRSAAHVHQVCPEDVRVYKHLLRGARGVRVVVDQLRAGRDGRWAASEMMGLCQVEGGLGSAWESAPRGVDGMIGLRSSPPSRPDRTTRCLAGRRSDGRRCYAPPS